MLEADTLEGLVYAAGGCIENNIVVAPGGSPAWAGCLLTACAVLCGDRSVARGSTLEYFTAAYRRLRGAEPELRRLLAAGVITLSEQRLNVSPEWRVVWRLAQLLTDRATPASPEEIFIEFARRYEPVFPGVDPSE